MVVLVVIVVDVNIDSEHIFGVCTQVTTEKRICMRAQSVRVLVGRGHSTNCMGLVEAIVIIVQVIFIVTF